MNNSEHKHKYAANSCLYKINLSWKNFPFFDDLHFYAAQKIPFLFYSYHIQFQTENKDNTYGISIIYRNAALWSSKSSANAFNGSIYS